MKNKPHLLCNTALSASKVIIQIGKWSFHWPKSQDLFHKSCLPRDLFIMKCPLLHGNIQKKTDRETEKSML